MAECEAATAEDLSDLALQAAEARVQECLLHSATHSFGDIPDYAYPLREVGTKGKRSAPELEPLGPA